MTAPRSFRPAWGRALVLPLTALVAALAASCSGGPAPPPPVAPTSAGGDLSSQINTFCGRCHAVPAPDVFPRSAWKDEIEQMYRFYGLTNLPLPGPPPPPEEVVRSYEERAPETLPAAVFSRATTPCPVAFERQKLPLLAGPSLHKGPHISHINLVPFSDPKRPDILICDMGSGEVAVLNPRAAEPAWRVLAKLAHPAHAEVIDLDGDGVKDVLVAELGNYAPTDRRDGAVVWLRGKKDGTFERHILLEGVGRVADVQAADFRGTGKLDLVVACFGWRQTGEVILLENHTPDAGQPKFVPRIIDPRHGAIHVPVADLNGDGKPDFVALFSQEHETIVAFLNEGGGRFRPETIYAAPHPNYGSSGIQLVDLNGDGNLDILYTNGDVMDRPYLLKPWHGVQWLEGPGRSAFPWRHHPITALYGIHRAIAADFDGDGDTDIIAVSYLSANAFPQRKEKNLDAVVLLEQTAPGTFARHTLETVTCDHVTCAVGDLYGTGRLDLVVGNFTAPDADHPVMIWKNRGKNR